MTDNVLSSLESRWNLESVHPVSRDEDVRGSPFAIGGFAGFGHLEPYSTETIK